MNTAKCTNCGCELHRQTSRSGVTYWASNSGNAFCIWPNPSIRHTSSTEVNA